MARPLTAPVDPYRTSLTSHAPTLSRGEPVMAPLCQGRGFGAGKEGRLLGREARRAISLHPMLMLR